MLQHCSRGRCKIFIPGVYPDVLNNRTMVDSLPYAEQASSLFGGTNNGNGMFSYPNIDSIVYCLFLDGDQNFPVYFASSLGGPITCDEKTGEWAKIRDNVNSPVDNIEEDTTINGFDSQKHLIKCQHSTILIEQNGTITIQSNHSVPNEDGEHPEDEEQVPLSTIKIDADGKIHLKSHASIELESDNININATGRLTLHGGQGVDISSAKIITTSSNGITQVKCGEEFKVESDCIFLDGSKTENQSGGVFALGVRHGPKIVAD